MSLAFAQKWMPFTRNNEKGEYNGQMKVNKGDWIDSPITCLQLFRRWSPCTWFCCCSAGEEPARPVPVAAAAAHTRVFLKTDCTPGGGGSSLAAKLESTHALGPHKSPLHRPTCVDNNSMNQPSFFRAAIFGHLRVPAPHRFSVKKGPGREGCIETPTFETGSDPPKQWIGV